MDDLRKTSLVGRKLAHYRISTIIGAGGMGEVYRAADTRLGRDVALKVLPSDMACDPDRLARFQREARAVAALNHPNVVTVYSVEEADNLHFITMELIEGQPLDRLISSEGLPVDRIIEIANALAEALAAAHEKGILHRDLKPANVMVTSEGRVKVLDFGLAKDVSAEGSTDATLTSAGHTQAGIVMGTPAYMSPEQISGRTLDHRTDIFSLGVMLYEMTTGRRPFVGTSSAELVSSILRDSPASVTEFRPELPADIGRVIRRCLEKDPRHRMQTARDVSNEFRDLVRTTAHLKPTLSSATRTAATEAGKTSAGLRGDEGFWVAVLPFKYAGSNADLSALAEGLSEEVITGFSRFSYLRVIARGSTAKYSSESGDVRVIGKELGARYVMEGRVRQAGARVRVMVQLSDASGGVQLWAETYERPFDSEAVFNLQDDLVPRIVSTVADSYGVLPHSMSLAVRRKDPDLITPYEALLRSFSYAERVTAEEHIAAKTALKRAVEQDPNFSDCWAMLSILQTDGNIHGLDPDPDSFDDALRSAQRAVDIAPTNHKGYQALAWVRYFLKEFPASLKAAERAIALNPMDGGALVYVGQTIAFAGDWERGCSLILRAAELNPNHAGWYWYTPFLNAYRKNDYRGALDYALKINMPGFPLACIALAAAHGQLGEAGEAQQALCELLTLRPDYASLARSELSKIWDDQLVEHLIDGLRKAGLDVVDDSTKPRPASAAATATKTGFGARRASVREDEGFWVAVLPFKHAGSSADLGALAEGLSEEIITGLSRFSYLRVIARGSTARYSSESGDVRAIGKELGARYVMEGTLRQAGSTIRLAVQLVDTETGAHLWAETFERPFHPDQIFALQDQLVPRIVSTIADAHGILTRSISAAVRKKSDDQLSPYEAVFRVFSLHEQLTAHDHAACRDLLERVVRDSPDAADCWAMLATLYGDEDWLGLNPLPDSLGREAAAAQRAVELAPGSQIANHALAQSLFQRHEWQAFRPVAERTIALNPMSGAAMAFLGGLLACTGEWDRGCALADAAMKLQPNFAGYYWLAPVLNAYRTRDYRAAIDAALRIQMPGFFWAPVVLTAAHGQIGDREAAQKALRELLALIPNFAAAPRQQLEKWLDPELAGHFMEGLRKADLETLTVAARPPSSGAKTSVTPSGEARADEGFWVAVLPFKYTGSNADLKALTEGLTEEVITGLSRFSYLRVIARGSTAKYSSESGDVRAIGKELGARYVMEASLRQAGSKLRLAVQLVEATTGSHLWAETFERTFTPETIFDLQDDLVPRIVATVTDGSGILMRSMADGLRSKPVEEMTGYEAMVRAYAYSYRFTAEEHAICRKCAERAVELAPDLSQAWVILSYVCSDEYAHDFDRRPDALERAFKAAQRAIETDASNPSAHAALAKVLFFRKEYPALRSAAERAIELNPLAAGIIALLGMYIAYSGEWERGCALVERAAQMNPRHPGWYWAAPFTRAYRERDYRGAIQIGLKFNMPGASALHKLMAAAYGQLGEREAAQRELDEVLRLNPNAAREARKNFSKWHLPDTTEHLLEGLRKAGLKIPEDNEPPASARAITSSVQTASGQTRAADEGFWVAVLPFKYTGSNQDLKAFAEGLSEEVITGLSRFSYLRVIARGSTAKYSSESGDVRAIGKELGARYVMEGSLRHAGSKLRLAVQLADTVSGVHLWAETYEHAFTPETVFEVQDNLVPRIVSTVADQYGVLPRTMSEALRQKSADALTPHEAVLRTFSYFSRITREEHAAVRSILERAVKKAPDHADSWAMLAMIYRGEFAQGYNTRPNPLDRALEAAQRAVELAPAHALGYYALATIHFFRKEKTPFRVAAEKALALNPLDASVRAFLGLLIASAGEWERGCRMVESAMQLNPNCPGYFYFAHGRNAYRQGKYEEVLECVARIHMPSYFHVPAIQAAALGQLGRREEAQKAVQALLALYPNFGAAARQEYAKWYDPEEVERLVEGLRKAGLDIPDVQKPDVQKEAQNKEQKPTASDPVPVAPSIAVLPFANMSDDKNQDYFSDGLAEEIINLLAQVPGLKVIARTSAFAFRGKEQDIRGIAQTLGVSTVLEGGVRRSGSRIRVTGQLINAADGSHLWSERYDRELSDIFAVQDEISTAIAKALRVRLRPENVPQRYTPKLEAYEAYLKAKYHEAKVTPESMELVRQFYEQACTLDPGFAMSHVGLGFYWHTSSHFGRRFAREVVTPARAEAERALQIDPSLPEAHAFLGYIAAMHDLDWAAAERHFHFPGAKDVGFWLVRPLYGWVQFWQGNVEPAIKLAQRAIEQDPLDGWTRMNLHAYLQAAGRDQEALEQLKKVVELDPNQVIALVSMAMIHADKGDLAEALKIVRRAYAVGPWSPDTAAVLAGLTRRNGEEVDSSLMKALGSGEMHGDARAHALFHLLCGEIDPGADWAEKAIEQRDSSMMIYLRFVVSKGLRASHRWPKIAQMINLPAWSPGSNNPTWE